MSESKTSNRPAGMTPLLRGRWSPRAFADKAIPADAVTRMLEAAQWAMSSSNGQPWRIVYATKADPAAFQRILETLVPLNQGWAKSADMLGVAIWRANFEHNNQPNTWSQFDTGAAMALFTVQGEAEGVKVHQMGGVNAAAAEEALGVPEGYRVIAAFAAGYPGDAESLPEPLKARELAPGQRKPLAEIAFKGVWGGEL